MTISRRLSSSAHSVLLMSGSLAFPALGFLGGWSAVVAAVRGTLNFFYFGGMVERVDLEVCDGIGQKWRDMGQEEGAKSS